MGASRPWDIDNSPPPTLFASMDEISESLPSVRVAPEPMPSADLDVSARAYYVRKSRVGIIRGQGSMLAQRLHHCLMLGLEPSQHTTTLMLAEDSLKPSSNNRWRPCINTLAESWE
jgi:hypothetical protein